MHATDRSGAKAWQTLSRRWPDSRRACDEARMTGYGGCAARTRGCGDAAGGCVRPRVSALRVRAYAAQSRSSACSSVPLAPLAAAAAAIATAASAGSAICTCTAGRQHHHPAEQLPPLPRRPARHQASRLDASSGRGPPHDMDPQTSWLAWGCTGQMDCAHPPPPPPP